MIPSPKLDDREFRDIVAEAIRLIPRYAPEWTNHNPSDPGITLIELAAWMTDLILWRLNRVPEKNYIAFLNLLGIKLKAPQAARGLLQFRLVEGAQQQIIPIGTQVATPQATDEETISFETERDLIVVAAQLDRCVSYYDERYSDNSDMLDGSDAGFEVFGGAERVDRFLYIADPRFEACGDSSILRLFLGCPEHGGRDLARLLEWEYWNGDRWRELQSAPVEVDRGEVCFFGPLPFARTAVADLDGLWLRGRLAEITNLADTEIDIVRSRVEVAGEGLAPERAFANLDNDAFIFLDLAKNVFPLGKEPKVDCIFYVACDEVLRMPDADIQIDFALAEANVVPRPHASDDLTLSWEYHDGKKWRPLGRSGPRGTRPGAADFGFHDTTNAFTQTGSVSFHRPRDMEPVEVGGEPGLWLRARLEVGDYGLAGSYTLDNEKWLFRDDRPLRPPAFRSITFRSREEYGEVRHVLAFNDFEFSDLTEDARTEYTIFQPFTPQADESPTIYLGFDGKLPNENQAIYFQMAEDLGPSSASEDGVVVLTGELERYQAEQRATWEAEQRLTWEYWNGGTWAPLPVDDGTHAFTTSGFVDFVAPEDAQPTLKFTEERYWLRARLEMGGYVKPPRALRVLTNAVFAHHQTTYRDEILGSSDATPLQAYKFLHGPLLEDQEIVVRERQQPPDFVIEELGQDAVIPAGVGDSEEVWVRWKRVDSLFESGPLSRHYLIDHQAGKVMFGDGRKGMIPPEGPNSIVARRYRTGGGSAGNLNAHTLTSLSRAIAYIDAVTNPIGANGGADRETVDEAKERAPYTIKSRDRAVTAEDFEMLALRASTSLARAQCVPDRQYRGAVRVVVIPKAETEPGHLARRLVPSNEVLRHVKRYLDERRLVATMLNVVKPRYKDLSVKVTLVRRTLGTSDRLRAEIETRLRRYLHPLIGGRDEKGWRFGRSVFKTDLIHLVEEVPGVDGVADIDILDEVRNVHVEQIRIDPDELPFLIHVRIVEKVRDEII